MAFNYVIVCPYEAVAMGRIASFAVPQMNTLELYRVGGLACFGHRLVLLRIRSGCRSPQDQGLLDC
jgi:hypothetical protein